MKAIRIPAMGKMEVVQLPEPQPKAGEVKLKLHYVGFCGSDLNTFRGGNAMAKPQVIPGHEIGATIEALGPGCPDTLKVGQAVTVNPYTNCGYCSSCRNGRPNACKNNETLGVQRDGAMREYICLPWEKIIPIGEISVRDAALIEPMSVGFHAVARGQVSDIDTVLVFGCGMVGLGAIIRCAQRGATVIAADLSAEKLELARKCGATYTINSREEDLISKVTEYTDGMGADVVIEAVGSADECIAAYRQVTGEVPEMPEWMFGYIHCRERYSSSDEILENAAEFKNRNIPLDVIVQDWQWWGKYGWNALRFDEDHYPDPKALTDALHQDNVHLMLSVWSKVDQNSEVGKALKENGYYIDGTDWVDFFNPAAADFYCRNFVDSLGRFGIDSWWFDATEPENDDLAGRKIGPDGLPGEFYRNVYPLKVNSTMYGGLKTLNSTEEPSILTRSAFSGIQRYGVVTWSGDVGNDFNTLKRQIAGGLGQMAAGLPWWTFDAGGFFRPGDQYTNDEYQERMIRWIQVGCFLPFMRVHGYMSKTEPWRYSEETQRLFVKAIELRKSLQPYVIECSKKVSNEGYTIMRPLVFDFAGDPEALAQESEYMFGPKYLVCPVLEAGVSTWKVYLPENEGGWEDFQTGEHFHGGQYLDYSVTMESIPVFIRK